MAPAPAGKVSCGRCCLRELCVPAGFSAGELDLMRRLVRERHLRVRRGEALFHAGERTRTLFAVHTGAFKTVIVTPDGRERVAGFSFAGDMLGLDAIGAGVHPATAIALEDSGVCSLPLDKVESTTAADPRVQRQVSRMLSREIVRAQDVSLLLASLTARERLAVFLLSLSRRFADRGFDPAVLRLPMSRPDIGSHLGLTPETVSRELSALERERVITAKARTVTVDDLDLLERSAGVAAERPGTVAA